MLKLIEMLSAFFCLLVLVLRRSALPGAVFTVWVRRSCVFLGLFWGRAGFNFLVAFDGVGQR